MNKNLKAADDVRRLLRGFAGLAEAAEAFEQVGQLEQARDEAQAALTKLRAENEQMALAISDAKAAAKKLNDQAGVKLSEADAQAIVIVTAAKSEAERIVTEARETASVALSLAQENVAQAKVLADEAIAKRDAAVAELAETEAKLDKARKQITKLLG